MSNEERLWKWGMAVLVAGGLFVVALPGWVGLFAGKKDEGRIEKKEYARLLAFESEQAGEDKYHWQSYNETYEEKNLLALGEKITGNKSGWTQIYNYLGMKGWRVVSVSSETAKHGVTYREIIFER